jgi:cobalt-zinc-cadmium efflux system membrane fusion protein
MAAATVLIVDDDEVLSQVLRRVLTRQGFDVREAASVEQALQAVRERPPQLALLDLRLPDGDGVELARQLRDQGSKFPLILITAYPLRLRDHPELGQAFTRILTKPLNLQELREAIDAAIAPPSPAVAAPPAVDKLAAVLPAPTEASTATTLAPPPRNAPPAGWRSAIMAAGVVAALVAVSFILVMPALGMPGPADWFRPGPAPTVAETPLSVELVSPKDDPRTIRVAPEVVESLGLKTATVTAAVKERPLTLTGSLNLDSDFLAGVVPRFPGEIIELAQSKEPGYGERAIRFGDHVAKDQILAVVWSESLGQKKSDLIDAQLKLWTDEKTLHDLEELYRDLATAQVNVRLAASTVATDRNTLARARRALIVSRVPESEVQEVLDEAKRVFDRKGEHDWEKEKNWARVEVKSPIAGTVVEKNRAVVGSIVDTSTDLFKVADLAKLVVWAHAYEEDLPDLRRLRARNPSRPVPWSVVLKAEKADDRTPVRSAGFDWIGPIIDPNQHTALVVGRADNPDNVLKAGQFIAATIRLLPPDDVVEIPTSAIVEEGGPTESIVFVQPDAAKPVYAMRRVKVVQRQQDVILVRSRLDAEEKKLGLQELTEGERVVSSGVLALKGALEDAQQKVADQAKKP